VVLLLIVGVVVMLMGGKKKEPVEGEEAAAHGEEKAGEQAKGEGKAEGGHGAAAIATPVYYELPGFLVNLNSTTSRVSFLKMSVTLELRDAAAVALMDANKPRIQDTFNTYLRELRPADIQGSAGIYRLRTELISRLNSTIAEGVVKDILFGEIIVQ
jgi:flagellar FliL protein